MKTMKKGSLLLALLLLVGVFCGLLVSCDTDSRTLVPFTGSSDKSGSSTPYVTNVKIEGGNIIVCYSNGSCVNIGSSVTNVTESKLGDVTINGSEGGVTQIAASRALLSTVQVICQFTKTVYYQAGPFGKVYKQDQSYAAAGSGVIYSLDWETNEALIITNQHVVYDADSNASDHISEDINIYMCGSTEAVRATYVGGSADYDIAVLRVNNPSALKGATAAKIADSSAFSVGSTALVVGNPEGAGISATAGIISVDSETIQMTAIDNENQKNNFRVIRVDAAVNSGNSGGGLYNAKGELIGIVNAKIVSSSIENIGYAIPSNVAVAVAENIIANNGSFRRAVLRVTPTGTDTHLVYDTETLLTSIVETVKVGDVTAGGAGETIGLKKDDTILSLQVGEREEVEVTRTFRIIDEMLNARVGDTIKVTVVRDGVTLTLTGTVTTDWIE